MNAQNSIDSRILSILHVLTLNGRNGEYGGPVRVAREISKELTKRGHLVEIFSGARQGSEPAKSGASVESYVYVRPILGALPVSSLWSFKIIPTLWKKIREIEIVHIHFARDLIPMAAAIICLIKRKPFVTQTHGMIISDGRLSTKIIDFLFTKPLLNRSQVTLVLTQIEFDQLQKIQIKARIELLPNGIAVQDETQQQNRDGMNRIIFCSRLQKRKGIDKFVDLAEYFSSSPENYVFEIYGPDGGELQTTQEAIRSRKLDNIVYKGSLTPEEVSGVLSNSDLLVLPSKDEPFPMVVIEALAVGTPVLVMPTCGLAEKLFSFNPNFVARTPDLNGIIFSFKAQKRSWSPRQSSEIRDTCIKNFSITEVVDVLQVMYEESIETCYRIMNTHGNIE
jgi:glycosyltransferase involved in cell wall biosynthesis